MNISQPVRVMIVEDQAPVRNALEVALTIDDNIVLVGSAASGQEAVEMCSCCTPDVVLMDIRMPKMDGIETTKQIRKHHPHIKVLALTGFLEPELVQNMMQAGASGYLLKHISVDELSNAIRATYMGKSVLDNDAYKVLFKPSEQTIHHVRNRS